MVFLAVFPSQGKAPPMQKTRYSLHISKNIDSGSCGGVDLLKLVLLLAAGVSHSFLVGSILEREAGLQSVINKVLGSER